MASTSAAPSPTSCSSATTAPCARPRCCRRQTTTPAESSTVPLPCWPMRRHGRPGRRRRPRLDGRLERGARGPRRANGARDDEGLPRRARDAPASDPGALRHPVPEPAAPRSPAAQLRGHGAARPARRDVDGARRGDRPRRSRNRSAGTTSRRSRSRCSTPTPTTRMSGASRRSSARPSATAST